MALRAVTHPDVNNPTADKAPNILMVDADPQCNLTAFFNREKQDDADEANDVDDGDDDDHEDTKFEGFIQCDSISSEAEANTRESLKQEANNIYTGLQPVLQNKANQLGHFDDKSLVHVRQADGNKGNVWLLPGSPRFGNFEQIRRWKTSTLAACQFLARLGGFFAALRWPSKRAWCSLTSARAGAR